MNKKLLITGGAGFVGANLAVYLKDKLKDHEIVCYDNLVRHGSELNVPRLKDSNITFIKGDIRNKEQLLSIENVKVIVECSAEPSVLAAYDNPSYTIETNLVGTTHCLELARRDNADFIFLSSNRVYPIETVNQIAYDELETRFDWKKNTQIKGCSYEGLNTDFPLLGVRSLYGATKLCSEHISLEYFDMFGMKGVINRLGIIAGPWQMGKVDQGLVGFWVAQHKFGNKLKYIGYGGSGKQVRDALHVADVCDLVYHQIENMETVNGKIYNVGGGRRNSFSLLELTNLVQDITNTTVPIDTVAEERKSDVRIYVTDNSDIQDSIGWSPKKSMEDILVDTNAWIDEHASSLEKILS